MIFSSVEFFLFFIVVACAYFLLPHRFRWILLLGGSYYFYMSWNATYVVLLLASTITAYLTALLMGHNNSVIWKKFYLCINLAINLGILFTFKYINFFMDSVQGVINCFAIPIKLPMLHVLLPIGISFYTFKTLSYIMDVYRGQIRPEKHFGLFALYVSFFPELAAGPIDRAGNLLPQFLKRQNFDVERIFSGIQLMTWGLFKKVVVADTLSEYVNSIYNNPHFHTGPSFWVATYFFAFQIYCDFSGYSDIAIGSGRVLGFDLMKNFNLPYFSSNITEFWRRWHISLSSWLRDYLYIPLGGNRKGRNRTYINLLITMVLGGIWHGASWTFVIWGALHGLFLMLSKATLPIRDQTIQRLGISLKAVHIVRVFVTFHIVCFTWIFFRANTVQDAFYIVSHLFTGWPNLFIESSSMAYGALGLTILLIVQFLQTRGEVRPILAKLPLPIRWAIYYMLIFSIILFGVNGGSQFIYFQF